MDKNEIFTKHQLGEYEVEIRAVLPDDFPCSLPNFHLVDRLKYGTLAHVAWGDNGYADICYGEKESFSADIHNPEIVFLASLEKVIEILDKSLNDEVYNNSELIREFAGVWRFHIHTNNEKSVICIAEPTNDITELEIRSNVNKDKTPINAKNYAIAVNLGGCNANHFLVKNSRNNKRINKGKGVLIPISFLLPPPAPDASIKSWWGKQLSVLSDSFQHSLAEYSRHNKAKELFIICHAIVDSDTVWFGIHCSNTQKNNLPLAPNSMNDWTLEAIKIDVVSKDILIPRGGGEIELNKRNVCLVGCGSLGGYISDMLASSGVGKLTLVDYDIYKIENIHRHKLGITHLFYQKNKGLKCDLEYKYPFLNVHTYCKKLLDISDVTFWNDFDLIIVAIGSPTHERKFNEFARENSIKPPVIYTWNEPFGIGGHAIATFSNKKGCLACAYINNEYDEPDLYPNINFIQRGQSIMTSIGGCGTEFIAYSGIDSMQTSVMVAKLAIKCMQEDINHGISVSWKGEPNIEKQEGIILTHRYWRFNSNLEYIPLLRDACVVCYE